jgi:hypothetical protein
MLDATHPLADNRDVIDLFYCLLFFLPARERNARQERDVVNGVRMPEEARSHNDGRN